MHIRIMIVDDHEIVRRGLRAFLDAHPDFDVIAEASSGAEAVRLANQHVPDVVLMDLVMPDMDGIEATRQVTDISPRTAVIVVTSYHQDEHIFPALQAGAISYVLKDIAMQELADVIHKAALGEAVLNSTVAARVIQEMRGSQINEDLSLVQLTGREMDVLNLIADGLSNSDIADKLVISQYTVKGHVSNILSKLHLSDRTQAAVYAWKEGLKRAHK